MREEDDVEKFDDEASWFWWQLSSSIKLHYKKRADLRRVFSQRRGGSNRPHGAPAVKFTVGDFNVATLRGGGKIYAVAPLEPPLRVGAVDRPNANKKI